MNEHPPTWEEIHGFRSPAEFERFVEFIERQHTLGLVEEKPVDASVDPYGNMAVRWFFVVELAEIWHLVAPDPPFAGVWERTDF